MRLAAVCLEWGKSLVARASSVGSEYLSSLSANVERVALATTFGCGIYLSYRGIKDLGQKNCVKGTCELLLGLDLMLLGGALALLPYSPLISSTAPSPEIKSSGALTSTISDSCPAIFSLLGSMGMAMAAARKINNPFVTHIKPSRVDSRISLIEAKSVSFAKRVKRVLDKGGTLNRIPSMSGVYIIKDSAKRNIAIFKPDDERNFGPNNRGFPGQRLDEPAWADIQYKELGALLQGNPSGRQHLAKLLDHDKIASLPEGIIVEIESSGFVQPASKGNSITSKRGYLQRWDSQAYGSLLTEHPEVKKFIKSNPGKDIPHAMFTRFEDHPLLWQIPLEEFQVAGLKNILLYNQDGHLGNYLVKKDANQIPHITPIDMDGAMPWALTDLSSFTSHPRAKEPFTPEALNYIHNLNPNLVKELTSRMNLSQQASINAKALAIVIREFAHQGLTLHDIHQFVASPQIGIASPLWKLMIQAQQQAVESLSSIDKDKYEYVDYHRKELYFNGGKKSPPDVREHIRFYERKDESRINHLVDRQYWIHFRKLLKTHLA